LLPALLGLAACAQSGVPAAVSSAAPAAAASEAPYDLAAQRAKLADVRMEPDTSYLSAEERDVVNLLIEASHYMSEIYQRQRLPEYDQVRSAVERNRRADRDLLLEMFDRNFGPWDNLADLRPFWGSAPMPEGAGFYPAAMTREEFDAYLAAHPGEREALTSPYTVVRRDGERLGAIPYSVEYREWLEPAARLLEQAAARTSNASLKRFLALRAEAF